MARYRSKSRLPIFAAATVLALAGLAVPGTINNAYATDYSFWLDDSCSVPSTGLVNGHSFTCTIGDEEREISIGTLGADGGFSDYDNESGVITAAQDGKSITISDDDLAANGYLHIYGPDQDIAPMVEGAQLRFDAGNLPLSDVIGNTFGIAEAPNNNPGDPQGGDEGGPNVTWSNPTGGKLELKQICEPAWAYDENADPDEFMDCVNVKDGDEYEAYVVHQNAQGGELHIEHGIRLVFAITANEGYEYVDIDMQVDPSDVDVPGLGDENGFEVVMPQNATITFRVVFKEVGTELIEVGECEECGVNVPEIVSAEATDAPEGATIWMESFDEDYQEVWEGFSEYVYGDDYERFQELYVAYIEADDDDEMTEILGQMVEELGVIVVDVFDIHLEDGDGVRIEYEGDGIKITLASSDFIDMIMDMLGESYDGDFEFVVGHLKDDGTYEILPLTDNGDGTYSFMTTSLSPFSVIARAAATTSSDDVTTPQTSDGIMTYVAIATVSLFGLILAGYSIRKNTKR